MPTYISLVNWTDQGIRDVKESGKRYDGFKELLRKHGGEARGVYMTMGTCDLVVVFEAPSDEVVAELMLRQARGGNVRTTTMKAFNEDEYRRITAAMG